MNGSGLTYLWLKGSAMAWLVFGRTAQALVIFDDDLSGGQVKNLDEMLRRWPMDAYALASRSHVRAQRGQRDEAIADLQALLAAQPERNSAYWFNLAYLLEDAGRYAEAEPAFRHALALDAKADRAWYGLGLVLIRLQRPDEAVAARKQNTKLQPMRP